MRRVLVVEDDPDIVELLTHYLEIDGWAVDSTTDGRSGLERLRANRYQLLILDLQLPKLDGLSVCREVRRDRRSGEIPIIMLTARGEETDRVVGLEVGADDYIVKPFSPKEVIARIRALFRRIERPSPEQVPVITRGPLIVDRERHIVSWDGHDVHLTAKEFDLLVALLDAHGRVLSRQHLLEEIWGYSYTEGTRTVDVHVRRVREKLPGLAPAIVTVKLLGYRLAELSEDR
jgi:two-component system alkaline phosphatase synthesis response regulator PhoP